MDLVSGVSNSIALVKRLREVSKNIAVAEFKNVLADLSNELADLKLEAASMKEELAALQEENALLKQVAAPVNEKPTGTKWGCYQFESEEGLFCSACWDSKRKKSRTTRFNAKFRICPVCKSTLGTG